MAAGTGPSDPDQPRVLVVDDDDSVRITLAAVLAKQGYAVASAASTQEAIRRLADAAFDVVVTDFRLDEGHSGVDVVSCALERDLDVVTIILTGYATMEAAVEALRGGATNFLPKPCNLQDLTGAIDRGLERRALLRQLREAQREAAGRAEAERLRAEAEQARERWRFLASAGEQLVSSLDYRTILDRLARLSVPAMADWCVVDVIEREVLEHVAVVHVDPAKEDVAREVQRRARATATRSEVIDRVLETVEPILVADIPPQLPTNSGYDAETLRLLTELRPRSMICVPLVAAGKALGVMSWLMSESDRRYQDEDVRVAVDLGRRAGLAIEHARLYRQREQEGARLRQIVDQLPEGILVVDHGGRLLAANDAADIMSGPYEPGQLPHLHSRLQLAGPDGRPLDDAARPLARALQGEVIHGMQATLVDRDGDLNLPVLVSSAPLRDPSGAIVGALAIVQDITELKTLEQQKEAFLSAAAHDLKTPLTSIQGAVQLLRRQLRRPDQVRPERLASALESVEAGTKKMTALIDELLDVSRLESSGRLGLDCRPTDLVKLAQRVAAEQQLTSRRHRIIVEAEAPAITGQWDDLRLERALTNLVANAIKYSPNGGPVQLRLALDEKARQAVVAVSDQGIGIPTRDLDRVFERFERGANLAPGMRGSGVGLAYVRQVVLQHGGSVSVQSQPGAGSTFTLRLPLATPARG